MNEKAREIFIKSLDTMMNSWGGDTPPEVYWAFNEFMEFYEAQTGETIGRLNSEYYDECHEDYEAIMKQIENK